MATIRDQILDAVVVALNTGAPSGIPVARRRRFSSIEADSLPVVDVAPLIEPLSRVGGQSGPIVKRKLGFVVRVWTAGDAPEIAADPIAAWVSKALAGNRLGGLAHDIEEIGAKWMGNPMDSLYGLTEIEFSAQYQTKTADQEAIV